MSEQDGRQAPALQGPSNDDKEAWQAYWQAQGQPWRTEPEIDTTRQKELAQRRAVTPDLEKGIYPFKDMKLSRADVEWLLATHENGRGPVDWSDENQRKRKGLDLRGADLRQVDLQNLPLACLQAGLALKEWSSASQEQRNMAVAHMESANLFEAQLQKAHLRGAHLERTNLVGAHLEQARLYGAHLEGAILMSTHLEETYLIGAHLERTNLVGAYLGGARLENVTLGDENHIGPRLVDVRWGVVNIAIVKWSQVRMLGDEYEVRQKKCDGKLKDKVRRLNKYEQAVRANRQLAVMLRAQGLDEVAARFSYRAQLMQRKVFLYQDNLGQYLFSGFLDLLAGYGYRPLRSLFWYLVIIFVFALAYSTFGHLSLWPPDAFVYSLTSFHGRGFFPGLEGKHSLHDPLIMLAAFEAVVGLFIEISFIATFTQRFFGR